MCHSVTFVVLKLGASPTACPSWIDCCGCSIHRVISVEHGLLLLKDSFEEHITDQKVEKLHHV
jgi:hypothetical protein